MSVRKGRRSGEEKGVEKLAEKLVEKLVEKLAGREREFACCAGGGGARLRERERRLRMRKQHSIEIQMHQEEKEMHQEGKEMHQEGKETHLKRKGLNSAPMQRTPAASAQQTNVDRFYFSHRIHFIRCSPAVRLMRLFQSVFHLLSLNLNTRHYRFLHVR